MPLLAVALLWTPTSIAATPADTAATHALLQADLQFDEAILHNAAASRAAVASLSKRLGGECHGVLAGAPNEELAPPSRGTTTPRAKGERQRSEAQLQTIELELDQTIGAAAYQPDRAAADAYASQVAPLSWSDPRIAPLVQFVANGLKEAIAAAPAGVCADMQSWAHSGYHILSAASREFEAAQTARPRRPEGSLASLLKPYEGAPERALIRHAMALRPRLSKALDGAFRASSQLRSALGIQSPAAEREREPVLGHGSTRAGSSFAVRRETPGRLAGGSCRHSVAVELQEHGGGSSSSVCLGGRTDREPSGSCGDEVETIRAAVAASVRAVRLRLSNGRTITSSVVRVPPRDGGPGGVYVQAIRGYSPYPVSLSELDAEGRIVRVLSLKAIQCRKEPAAKGPTLVTLAESTTPDGEAFSIQAIIVHFGHDQTSLNLITPAGTRNDNEAGVAWQVKPKAFPWMLGLECPPHEYAIVYGILSAPGNSVLARTPTGLVALTKVPIAADLHAGGPLVYGVFPTLPSELIVLAGDGSTLYSESLAARATEEREYCEGYVEA